MSNVGKALLALGMLVAVVTVTAAQVANEDPRFTNVRSTACHPVNIPAAFYKCALEKVKTFVPKKRTADGKPDLNGVWNPTRGAMSIEEITGQYGDYAKAPSLIVDPPNG